MKKFLQNFLIVVAVAAAVLFVQAVVQRQRISNIMVDAMPLIPDDCPKAYATFEPAYGIGDFRSLGGLSNAEAEFFGAMRDRIIERSLSVDPNDSAFYLRLVDVLAVMGKAQREHHTRLEMHQLAILKALGENREKLARRLDLAAWDAIMRGFGEMKKQGVVSGASESDLENLMRDYGAVDRRPIYIRELREQAEANLHRGADALGAIPSDPAALVAEMSANPPPKQYIVADTAFKSAQGGPFSYTSMFKGEPAPPMLEAIAAKALYNLAAMRTLHLIAVPPQKQMDEPSDYFVHLYVTLNPGAALATEGEMLGAFTEQTIADYNKAIADMNAGKLTGEEQAVGLALAQWGSARFLRLLARPVPPQAAQAYQQARNAAVKSPAGTAAIDQLEKAPGLLLMVR